LYENNARVSKDDGRGLTKDECLQFVLLLSTIVRCELALIEAKESAVSPHPLIRFLSADHFSALHPPSSVSGRRYAICYPLSAISHPHRV